MATKIGNAKLLASRYSLLAGSDFQQFFLNKTNHSCKFIGRFISPLFTRSEQRKAKILFSQ